MIGFAAIFLVAEVIRCIKGPKPPSEEIEMSNLKSSPPPPVMEQPEAL